MTNVVTTTPSLIEPHRAWEEEQHADVFDYWRFIPGFMLATLYECFNEILLLNRAIAAVGGNPAVLDIGCATGELYRYLCRRWPRVTYVGCDISLPAIRRAQLKFPSATFVPTGPDLNELAEATADIVFCRDVIPHQPDPDAFLRKLYGLARRFLVLKLRTRDVGTTVHDTDRSCQYMYGSWVPYIVQNCDEVVQAFSAMSPVPTALTFWKHYMVLGGQHSRFLPKDCYDPATGTAETALMVEKDTSGSVTPRVAALARVDGFRGRGRGVWMKYAFGVATGRGLRRVLGEDYGRATWW